MGIASAEKPLTKRRLWNMVTVVVFLTRKCMLKRRYLQEGFTKRGKLLANNVRNIMSRSGSSGSFGLREYEFSCSNSPAFTKQRHEHNYFSCIRPTSFGDEEERDMRVDILQPCNFPAIEDSETQTCDLGDGEEMGHQGLDRLKLELIEKRKISLQDFTAKLNINGRYLCYSTRRCLLEVPDEDLCDSTDFCYSCDAR